MCKCYAKITVNLHMQNASTRLCVKPWSNENASHRTFLLVPRVTANLQWLAVTCVSLRPIWACSNFTASFFQLASACESFEHKTQVDQCKFFLPARALELAEVNELYIGDSVHRVHWRKFRTCDDLCRRLTGDIANHF